MKLLPAIDLYELSTAPAPVPNYLVHLYVPRQEIITLIAKPKSGKSMMILDLIIRLARGGAGWGSALGIKVGDAIPSIGYLDAEGNERLVNTRIHQLEVARGLTRADAAHLHYHLVRGLKLDTNEGLTLVDKFVAEYKLDLLILDSYRRFMGGEENSSDSCAAMGRALMHLRDEHQLTVIVIHHQGHVGKHGRGSSDMEAWADMGQILKATKRGSRVHTVELTVDYSRGGYDAPPLVVEWRPTAGGRFDMVVEGAAKEVPELSHLDSTLLRIAQAGPRNLHDYTQAATYAGVTRGVNTMREALNSLVARGLMVMETGAHGAHTWRAT